MNNNKIKTLVLRVQELSLDITSNSNIDIFTDFASHVKGIYVRIYLNGWIKGKKADIDIKVYLDWNSAEHKLNYIIELLEEKLNEINR